MGYRRSAKRKKRKEQTKRKKETINQCVEWFVGPGINDATDVLPKATRELTRTEETKPTGFDSNGFHKAKGNERYRESLELLTKKKGRKS